MSGFVTLVVALFVMSLSLGCELASPTSPTPTPATAVTSSLVPTVLSGLNSAVEVQGVTLNWIMARGCSIQKPRLSSDFFGTVPEDIRHVSGSEVWALWLDPQMLETFSCRNFGEMSEAVTTRHYVAATFVRDEDQWRYCEWNSLVWQRRETSLGHCQ